MKLRITIDGTVYEAEVEVVDEEEDLAEGEAVPYQESVSVVAPPLSGASGNGNECRSPVMGLVVLVEVEAGQQVSAGQRVMVLEAMKMETQIHAPRACKVKSVHVATGDSVKVDQLLIEFE